MTTTTHDPWIDRLSEYIDGEMKREDREALERHVADCATCAVALAELQAVVERARTLEDRPPAEDLWTGIHAQIAPGGEDARGRVLAGPSSWWRRRLDLSLPQLAAAALVLALLSAGAMWLALGRSPLRAPQGGSSPLAASPGATNPANTARPPLPEPTAAMPSPYASAAAVNNPRYDQAVAELEQALADGRGRLEPRTVHILEQNLRTIDRAIDEARRAVAADPANEWLRSHLAATMKRKVDLLRTATMLTATQS
jgi:hypothetical protein